MTGHPRVELLRDLDRPTGWVLLVDGVEQSYIDDVDATHLEFEYMQHMALVIDAVMPAPRARDVVHLGGGAMSMARWLSATRPGARHVVVESSADVLDAVHRLGSAPPCRLIVADALAAMPTLPAAHYDLVLWDLYDGPRAVTVALTLEAVQAMRRLIRPGGLVLLNVSDAAPFDVVRPVLAAVRMCFDDVLLLAEPSTLRARRSGNCVLVGSVQERLPTRTLARRGAAAPVRARVVSGAALDDLIGDVGPATADAPLPLPDAALGRGFL